jgi:hypothetical protein
MVRIHCDGLIAIDVQGRCWTGYDPQYLNIESQPTVHGNCAFFEVVDLITKEKQTPTRPDFVTDAGWFAVFARATRIGSFITGLRSPRKERTVRRKRALAIIGSKRWTAGHGPGQDGRKTQGRYHQVSSEKLVPGSFAQHDPRRLGRGALDVLDGWPSFRFIRIQ